MALEITEEEAKGMEQVLLVLQNRIQNDNMGNLLKQCGLQEQFDIIHGEQIFHHAKMAIRFRYANLPPEMDRFSKYRTAIQGLEGKLGLLEPISKEYSDLRDHMEAVLILASWGTNSKDPLKENFAAAMGEEGNIQARQLADTMLKAAAQKRLISFS